MGGEPGEAPAVPSARPPSRSDAARPLGPPHRYRGGRGAASVVAPEAAVMLTRRDGSLVAFEATVLELTCIAAESAPP